MFEYSIFEYWGLHEEYPIFGENDGKMVFVFSQIMEWRTRFLAAIKPSAVALQSPGGRGKPKQTPRARKNCPIAIQQRRAEFGGESVSLIRPDEEIPGLDPVDRKVSDLVQACIENKQVASLELQVDGPRVP